MDAGDGGSRGAGLGRLHDVPRSVRLFRTGAQRVVAAKRARSNGILPLGAAPRPWPLIVKNGGVQVEGPQENEPTPTLADEADADALQQTVAVVGESEEEIGIDGQPEVVPESAGSTPGALKPVPVVAKLTDTPQTVEAEPQGVPQSPVAPAAPPVQTGETPGWRARR